MSDDNQIPSTPGDPATPTKAAPVPEAPTPKPSRMWPASTVIAGGIATMLLSGLIGGFIGAALDGSDDDRAHIGRIGIIERGGFDGRMGPGNDGPPGSYAPPSTTG